MKISRLLLLAGLLPLCVFAADQALKVDKARSYVDVDVDATKDFTAHLDTYETEFAADEAGEKIKKAVLTFKFSDLKTGEAHRDEEMIKWLGGGEPEGKFELGILALTPDGQGQASGRFSMHDAVDRVEFPVTVKREGAAYVVTGETTLDYRKWNLKVIRKAFIFSVDPEVKVRFKFTATPAEVLPSLVPPAK